MGQKTLVELLILLRDLIISKPVIGMCFGIEHLWLNDKITLNEKHILRDYILSHKPITFSTFVNITNRNWFWWGKFKKKPRIRYLNKHIKKLSNPKNI